jgi:hypothetical protein
VVIAAYLPVIVTLPQAGGTSYFGLNLWIGTWERNPDWTRRSIEDWPQEADLGSEERDKLLRAYRSQNDRPFLTTAIERYRTSPAQVLTAWVQRYRFLWLGTRTELTRPMPHTLWWFAFKGSMWSLNAAVIVFGLLGGGLALWRRDRKSVLLAPIIYIALIYIPFHNTEMRYSMPAVPFLLALAAYFGRGYFEGANQEGHRDDSGKGIRSLPLADSSRRAKSLRPQNSLSCLLQIAVLQRNDAAA